MIRRCSIEYLRQFPTGTFAGLARLKLDSLGAISMRPATTDEPNQAPQEINTTPETPAIGQFDGTWTGALYSYDGNIPIEATIANSHIVIKLDTRSGVHGPTGTAEGEVSDSGDFFVWGYNERDGPFTFSIVGHVSDDVAEGSVKNWGKFRLRRVRSP